MEQLLTVETRTSEQKEEIRENERNRNEESVNLWNLADDFLFIISSAKVFMKFPSIPWR